MPHAVWSQRWSSNVASGSMVSFAALKEVNLRQKKRRQRKIGTLRLWILDRDEQNRWELLATTRKSKTKQILIS
jgi:hypothetical protein